MHDSGIIVPPPKLSIEGPVSVMTLEFRTFGDFLLELKLYLAKSKNLVIKVFHLTRQTFCLVFFYILDKYNLSSGEIEFLNQLRA